jgi:hypothetical protein
MRIDVRLDVEWLESVTHKDSTKNSIGMGPSQCQGKRGMIRALGL